MHVHILPRMWTGLARAPHSPEPRAALATLFGDGRVARNSRGSPADISAEMAPGNRRNVFAGHVAVVLGFLLAGLAAATQYTAAALAHPPRLGPPLTVVAGRPLYEPWAWLGWAYR